jgi:hypothetical protein
LMVKILTPIMAFPLTSLPIPISLSLHFYLSLFNTYLGAHIRHLLLSHIRHPVPYNVLQSTQTPPLLTP